jgi:iron complex outermembrane receptor protein
MLPFRRALPYLVILPLIYLAEGVHAQQSRVLEEIIVTAQKREQGMAEVPISLSVIGADFIAERNLQSITEVTQLVPNVTITEQVLGFSVISIRGFSGGVNRGFEQSVGRYVDGVFSGRTAASSSDLNDIERVEILRGPQGTLFGNNTIAGSVNIITSSTNPQQWEGRATVTGGSDDYLLFNGTVSGPLSEAVSVRASAGHREQQGYAKNQAHNLNGADRHMGDVDKDLWRLKFDWHPSDAFSLLLASSGENASSNTGYGSEAYLGQGVDSLELALGPFRADALPVIEALVPDISFKLDDHKVAHNEDTDFQLDSRMHSLTLDYTIGEHQLRLISALGSYDDDNLFDGDFTPVRLLARESEESYDQFSHELQWISPAYDKFNMILGLFYLDTDLELDSYLHADFNGYGFPVSTVDVKNFEQDYRSAAVYGQGTYLLDDRWSVTAGLRYSDEKKSADILHTYEDCYFLGPTPLPSELCGLALGTGEDYQLNSDMNDTNTSPLLSLGYEINEDWNAYARYAEGYKSGGFSAEDFYVGNSRNEFDPETATTYELGLRGRLLDGSAKLSLALFDTEFKNLQVSLFNGVGFTVGNAAEATSQGFELEGSWLATQALTLNGSLGYTDASYDRYDSAPCTVTQNAAAGGADCQQNLSGKRLSRSPKWNASASAGYSLPWREHLVWKLGLDLIYSDEYYTDTDLDPNALQDAYTLVHARISLGDINQRWQVTVRGSNLTDEVAATGSLDLPFLAGAYGASIIAPRSYFLDITAGF